MLEGQGGNITVAVGTDGIIMVDGQFAPLSDKIKAAIKAISPLPIKYLINTHYPRRPHRRERELRQGRRHHRGARQYPRAPRRRHDQGADRREGRAAARPTRCRRRPISAARSRSKSAAARRNSPMSPTPTPTATPGSISPTPTCCATGDTSNNLKRYQNIDFANGGDVRGMIRALDTYLKASNDSTKIVPGHGRLANKADLVDVPRHAGDLARPHQEAVRRGQDRAGGARAEAARRSRRDLGQQPRSTPRGIPRTSTSRSSGCSHGVRLRRKPCCRN